MRARRLALTGAILAASALAPAVADAGTVSLAGSELVHVPSPGQNSRLGVNYGDSESPYLRVTEEGLGATVTAGPGCRAAGGAVECARSSVQTISLLGGDGNDILYNATWVPATLDGQSGADTLYGGLGADELTGGTGFDSADYGYRTRALTVDPDGRADDGAVGEGDTVAPDIESIVGGLAGDSLDGGPGANRLSGGGGADRLDGGMGVDTIDGGAGSDTIISRETEADTVTCGTEFDNVAADPADSIALDCESVDVQAASVQPSPLFTAPSPIFGGAGVSGEPITMTADGRALVRVACPAVRTTACRGTVTIRENTAGRASISVARKAKRKGKVLGKRNFAIAPGRSKNVSVKLSRNGRHRVLRKRRVRCSVNVGVRGQNGKSEVTRKQVTLKAPKRERGNEQ